MSFLLLLLNASGHSNLRQYDHRREETRYADWNDRRVAEALSFVPPSRIETAR